ncbi:MAG: hypothetical protein EOP19_14225 [Hyphomicrobiales bacterium]|nr:MAG: hypothetical protein EOP19_14225 [Hyphomicrobiales bacterium]
MQHRPIAVLWPDEENYARFREISDGVTAATLKDYRASIAKDLEAKERAGIKFDRLPFDVEELLVFARSEGSARVTSKMRATFAAMQQHRRDTATKH